MFPFMAFISYIYDPYQSSQIKSNRTDRTNRNILCPYVIMRCTLGMCSEYGLLAMLTVCTERTIRQLLAPQQCGSIGHDCIV